MSQAITPESREGLRGLERGSFLGLEAVRNRMRILPAARHGIMTETQGAVDRAQEALRAEADRREREQKNSQIDQLEQQASTTAPVPVPGSHDVEQIRAFIRDYPTTPSNQG